MIAVMRSGMDCDCTQYSSVRHVEAPKSILKFIRDEEEHREYLDGPESVSYGKPSDNEPDYRSADRAMEAYENGHPSRVEWGPL